MRLVIVVFIVVAVAVAVAVWRWSRRSRPSRPSRPYTYSKNVLSRGDFNRLVRAVSGLRLRPEKGGGKGGPYGRMVADVPDEALKIVRSLVAPRAPVLVQYREYPAGSGMHWHRDQVLWDPPQTEYVLTLANDSDSRTCFEDGTCIRSEPNSLVSVRAGGVAHTVVPATDGLRTIIKFAVA